jgi:murein L,D-transpeptidase YafK
MRSAPFLLAVTLPLFAACQGGAPRRADTRTDVVEDEALAVPAPAVPLVRAIDSLGLDARTVRFRVDKSERVFEVLARTPGAAGRDTVLKQYPCVLGGSPVGDKFMQGDRRTPEGTFTFRGKRVHDRWHKFIWVDYPNAESWRRFKERQANGSIPAGKDIGGEIGIHGVPDGMDDWIVQGVDWTWGCIALRNADVDEIYPFVRPQHTLITIEP